jgi:hypothetical protein
MAVKPWSKCPTDWIADKRIQQLTWQHSGSKGTAALMVFFALCQYAESLPSETYAEGRYIARLSYDSLAQLVGLSRHSISNGLTVLAELRLIGREAEGHQGWYAISGLTVGQRWAKLPGRALLTPAKTMFAPFEAFHLRSKHELNALRLLYYFASIRDGGQSFSEAAYETIHRGSGVPERDIPSAISFLVTTEFITRAGQELDLATGKRTGANRYYLKGYQDLVRTAPAASETV